MIEDQGELAIVIDFPDDTTDTPFISAYSSISDSTNVEEVALSYLSASDAPEIQTLYTSIANGTLGLFPSTVPSSQDTSESSISPTQSLDPDTHIADTFVSAKKKYKPVHLKVRPIATTLPDKFRIRREITGDPLADLPQLRTNPPPFQPTGRYTADRREKLHQAHDPTFLRNAELDLMDDFMCKHEKGFAWDDTERGRFKPDFFPPVELPVVEHKPWVQRNIPIPPGLYDEVCSIIRKKIAAGVYEPSNSSYRSRWFCVLKKDGKSLRIVHSLEPLNAVTIQQSGVTPTPEHLAEMFGGRACGGMLDLYIGYDERLIAPASRDYTTFQTPYGAMRLVTLPMGWTNSVPIFHDDVTYILQDEIPEYTIPYIDDVPVRGPASRYVRANGTYETIPNSDIRRFVWEHFQTLNRIVQRMKYAGGTFSGLKLHLCAPEITVLGHRCTYEGRLPDPSRVAAIRNWGPCHTLSDVRAFLGTVGVLRIFIRNFAHRAHHLVQLTRKGVPFEFGPLQLAAQEDLKAALLESPALRAINYNSPAPVILAVDTSFIAVGYHLCQCDEDNPRKRFYSRFGSITLNDRESRFSQPKLEIYGLYRTLRTLRLYIIGVRNLVVEVDARYIKGMLQNPDIQPTASINRWILGILMFHFTLVHVPGSLHGPDGLSRRPRQPGDPEEEEDDDFEDWIDRVHNFMHFIHPIPYIQQPVTYNVFANTAVAAPDPPDDAMSRNFDYKFFPRSETAAHQDELIPLVMEWHRTLQRPDDVALDEYEAFIKYCMYFFLDSEKLWRKDPHGAHKLVAAPGDRLAILFSCHDKVGHRGIYATRTLLLERFWWPSVSQDIAWYVRSCDLCQRRQMRQVLLPPTVATPAPLFAKIYIDTMHMPKSNGYKYIVQGRCSLTFYPEWRKLRAENSAAIATWLYEDVLCRWGALSEVVTDNGGPFVKALESLDKRFGIRHIRISGYNSRANGIVERSHFDVRQALFKAADGDQSKWASVDYSVFWAERITNRKRMGTSPYFAVTGTHPLTPLDIIEATYLLPPPTSVMSTTDLIARRAIALQKRSEQVLNIYRRVYSARRKAARRFEEDHQHTIRDYNFQPGSLVLMRHTQIEKSLDRKMRPRYTGPLIVIARNRGGAYILCELDGSVFDRPVAAFRLLPYLARQHIPLPSNFLDITSERFAALKKSSSQGDDSDDERSATHDSESSDEASQASDE